MLHCITNAIYLLIQQMCTRGCWCTFHINIHTPNRHRKITHHPFYINGKDGRTKGLWWRSIFANHLSHCERTKDECAAIFYTIFTYIYRYLHKESVHLCENLCQTIKNRPFSLHRKKDFTSLYFTWLRSLIDLDLKYNIDVYLYHLILSKCIIHSIHAQR